MASHCQYLQTQGPHIVYTEWGKKYGKIFKVPSRPILLLPYAKPCLHRDSY